MSMVDVVLPVFNGQQFISHALDSVCAQSLPARRIIVVDDGSNDGTLERVESFVRSRNASTIEVVRQPNAGPSSARNAGIRVSDAPFVAFLDADDGWAPDKLRLQMEVFRDSDSRLGVVYCDTASMTENGGVLRRGGGRRLVRGNIHRDLQKRNIVRGSSSAVVVRRQLLEQVGSFDERLRVGEDWDMWLRLSGRCHFDFVDKPLAHIRRRPGSDLIAQRRNRLEGELLLLDKLAQNDELVSGAVRSFRRRLSELGLRLSDLEGFSGISAQGRQLLSSFPATLGQWMGSFNRTFLKTSFVSGGSNGRE